MEFEMQSGNKKNIDKLRQRVEEYLEKAFVNQDAAKDASESEEDDQENEDDDELEKTFNHLES